MRRTLFGLLGFGLVACAAPEVVPQSVDADAGFTGPATEDLIWRFDDHAAALRVASCPSGSKFERAQSLEITATSVERGPEDVRAEYLQGLTLAGAWQLTADDSNFGGLSGLAVMRSGSLLAVTDAGAFVWIGIDPETGAPDGIGSIGYMRGANGKTFPNKQSGDSEGLALKDGVALVSFEQNHRVEAFDLETCGVAARAVRVVDLPPVIDGKKVPDNRGAEALALGDGLWAGFEFRQVDGSPTGRVMTDGSLDALDYAGQPGLYLQTGADIEDGMRVVSYRAYDPLRGSRVILEVQDSDGVTIQAAIKKPLPADNFEGVAFGKNPSGARRIWLISDDNFNPSQRTLLLAFDLE